MSSAIVVGSGPNGLVAAVTLARAGWEVTVLEANEEPGGGTRSAELTVPGLVHDVCSAVHPLGLASPALRDLPLGDYGLRWIHPDVPLAHPLDDGRVALLHRTVGDTAADLRDDGQAYRRLVDPLVRSGSGLVEGVLSPFHIPPRHPYTLARFGLAGLPSANHLARRFETEAAQALVAGLAGHSVQSLRAPLSGAYGLFLGLLAHLVGWPVAEGGSQAIAQALIALLEKEGGRVECGHAVTSLDELPGANAVLLDVSPRAVLRIGGDRLPARYRRALTRYRYGAGVFKLDWALDGPIPWSNPACGGAGTVHVGGTLAEVAAAEAEVQSGRHPARPFVLLAQPTRFDRTRAPDGLEAVWGYCHVPNGSTLDMTDAIEAQIERFAPGFRDRIVARHRMTPVEVEAHDANNVGGDITGGVGDLRQFVVRPVFGLHPWRTPVRGLFLCSASTPPGAGVHGMCGWHAAQEVLRAERRGRLA
jgi:phytoene dehydrogenase-like protein